MNTKTYDTAREPASTGTPGPRGGVLVSPQWLTAHLSDPQLRVVEVDVSPAAYDVGHVDGAVLWNVYADLKDPDYRPVSPAALEGLLVRSGIGPESTVVFYGYAPALGFWLMTLLGHRSIHILDCSRDTWRAEGYPWSTVEAESPWAAYRLGAEQRRVRADQAAVREAIDRPGVCLLDVRSLAEFRGERFWPSGGLEPNGRAGHVPTAIHHPIDAIYDQRGAFRTAGELRERFAACLDTECELIIYCTIGGRAATAWFVLTQLLGRDHVRVYDGSWAEWGRMPGAPVAVPEHAAT